MTTHATVQVEALLGSEPPYFVSGRSRSMRTLETAASEIAGTNIPVVIMGESGTGKQVLSRMIHDSSLRRSDTVQRVDCGTLTVETMEVELGRACKAPFAGTIIFDEVGDLNRECQRRLLHMLPDGDNSSRREVLAGRLIATTNQSLEQEVRAGRFRSDLFYRLNGVCLRVPPLRERTEDIKPLVEFFLSKHANQLGKPTPSLSETALARLHKHTWPGNVRELENVAMAIVALGDEEIALADLSSHEVGPHPESEVHPHSLKVAARAASREAERELILKALARTRWNRKRAAAELQISYKSLLYKLKQIGLPNSDPA
jgi:two-component system, NtrC family, response regulator AtoC